MNAHFDYPTEQRIMDLEQAQQMINEACDLIRQALDGTSHELHADAYILAHLDNWANGSNPYDYSIPKYIEELMKETETES